MLLLLVLRHRRSSVFNDLFWHDWGRLGAHFLTHSFLAACCIFTCCSLSILNQRFLHRGLFDFFGRFGLSRSLSFLCIRLRVRLLLMLFIGFFLLLSSLLLLILICRLNFLVLDVSLCIFNLLMNAKALLYRLDTEGFIDRLSCCCGKLVLCFHVGLCFLVNLMLQFLTTRRFSRLLLLRNFSGSHNSFADILCNARRLGGSLSKA